METEKTIIKRFETKVRNLINAYTALKRENTDLYEELEKKDEEIRQLQQQVASYKKDYEYLKLAKMIEISDDELKGAKQKITNLVREVNKCINLLNTAQ